MGIGSKRILAILSLAACAALAAGEGVPAGEMLRGQTEPVATVEVPAAVKGILAEVNVKEGQAIKKGDVLVRLDDALQKQKVEFERVSAEGTAEIQYAVNQVSFAQDARKQFENVGSGTEKQEKELAVKQAQLSLEAAKDKQAQAKARYEEERITLEHMTLRSPIDGSVLRVKKHVGEETDEGPVVVVVQTSKLIAIFYPGKEMFGKVAVGDKVPLDFEGVKREGVVVTVDPVMDPVSQRFRVKLEVENSRGDLAGGVGAVWMWK